MSLQIGQQIGSNEITLLIGKGRMGEVYRARDSQTQARCGHQGPAPQIEVVLNWLEELKQRVPIHYNFPEGL